MTTDAIARVISKPGQYAAIAKGYDTSLWPFELTVILAADRLAQRERPAALAREIGRGLAAGELIARAIEEDGA